ncbi:hypothetical protein PAECIP112173_02495 [Paenibacillus sp. JJ-100]|uniref:hypothetical protein n=1 Tax=Paenibacillus sp. JJ-100 TaxID=2974896 RepID=UPI0022FF8A5D|nr:hypothetical protein [Paenibacillus sp. JJ-100]CAI6077647.1 hypothetical protein PAECIP112173_02495 [Paenibacillus sp. JJ-100]
MDNICNNTLTFIGNFVMAYFIFGEGTLVRPLIFAFCIFMLMMAVDWFKSRGDHKLN